MKQFISQMSGQFYAKTDRSLSDPHQIAYIRNLHREIKQQDVLNIPLDELEVVVFDIETTGFHPFKGDRLLSIGAVKMQGDLILEENTFYSMVHCIGDPSEQIEKLTGITKEQLMEAPPLEEVLKDFYRYVGSDALVAHHSNHEKQFMKHASWTALKTVFQHRVLDTSFLTSITHPESGLFTLDDYCDYYEISIQQRHHALYDALAAAKLWSESIRQVRGMGYAHLNEIYAQLAKLK
ncbi:exonuclease domain-containing protein [Virgibacillus xinjiangensis]|uniref:Exonuclease domain-containing protein n=1 Tax=Virgibacillus xinjiangensis TaxID=393090 RepID=A0ABV7CXH8_9BACI